MRIIGLLGIMFVMVSATTRSCDGVKEEPCPEDIICTQEFKTLEVAVTNSSGDLIQLDSTSTIQLRTGETLVSTQNDGSSGTYGYHLIVSDVNKKTLDFSGELLEFNGFLNGKQIIQEQYIVAGGCCHIKVLEGKTEIQL